MEEYIINYISELLFDGGVKGMWEKRVFIVWYFLKVYILVFRILFVDDLWLFEDFFNKLLGIDYWKSMEWIV